MSFSVRGFAVTQRTATRRAIPPVTMSNDKAAPLDHTNTHKLLLSSHDSPHAKGNDNIERKSCVKCNVKETEELRQAKLVAKRLFRVGRQGMAKRGSNAAITSSQNLGTRGRDVPFAKIMFLACFSDPSHQI